MVTSEFVLLFLDIINMRGASACCCADLTDDEKGHRAEGEESGACLMDWVSCGIHLESLCLSCLRV